jgi:hypothetical protein
MMADVEKQDEFRSTLRSFLQLYKFQSQVVAYDAQSWRISTPSGDSSTRNSHGTPAILRSNSTTNWRFSTTGWKKPKRGKLTSVPAVRMSRYPRRQAPGVRKMKKSNSQPS